MHEKIRQNETPAAASLAVSNENALRMKPEDEYGMLRMQTEQDPCVDHQATLSYNSYRYDEFSFFFEGRKDDQILDLNDEIKAKGGKIKDVLIVPHLRKNPDEPGIGKESGNEFIQQYVRIMSNAGVSTVGVKFHYRTGESPGCGECDGGFTIDVIITYTTCE